MSYFNERQQTMFNTTLTEAADEVIDLKKELQDVKERLEDAQEAIEELISYRNHLGLMSEDINEKDGSMWGNFPQAYSHVGLVNAATRINNKLESPIYAL